MVIDKIATSVADHLDVSVAPVGGTDTDWPTLWKQSDEAAEVRRRINEYTLCNNSGNIESEKAVTEVQQKSGNDAYASSFMTMTRELVIRNFRAQWRGKYLSMLITHEQLISVQTALSGLLKSSS